MPNLRRNPAAEPRGQRDLSLAAERRVFAVGRGGHGERLDRFLKRHLPWRSRQSLQRLIAAGRVRRLAVGGSATGADDAHEEAPRASSKVARGERWEVTLGAARPAVDGDHSPPAVLFSDRWLLAVDKPSGLSVYPSRRHRGASLAELVHRRWRQDGGAGSPPFLCHRLDRETSGGVLFARDRATRAAISEAFTARRVGKTYLAVVAGVPDEAAGTIDLPLGPAADSTVQVRRGPRPDGRRAVTRWRLVEPLGESAALLELAPETGRRHQLRAHLAAIGHPILGDKLYRGGDALFLASLERQLTAEELAALGHPRLALHASRLTLAHPATGEPLTIASPLPADFAPLLGRGV